MKLARAWPPRPAAPLQRPSVPAAGEARDLSVVIPVFDEEECLDELWRRLRTVLQQSGLDYEVLFVDDGSRDRSLSRLRRIRDRESRVRVLVHAANRGQSAALISGFHAARGTWVATLDADLQNPPEELPRLLHEAGPGTDLVFGRRRVRRDAWTKRVASRIGNGARNLITGHSVRDTGCSLKLFRAASLRRIPLFDGAHRFLPTLFHAFGFGIREIDVDHAPRWAGSSKYGIGRRAWQGLLDCFAVRWLRARGVHVQAKEVRRA